MSQPPIKIIKADEAPKLPPLISVSVVALLMPSLLLMSNFPTTLNCVAVLGLVVAVILDRLSMRADLKRELQSQQALLKAYLKQVDTVAGGKDTTTSGVPKNKDGETLQ